MAKKKINRVNSAILRAISNMDCCEMDEKDVDVSSFQTKDEMNPRFWKDGHLDSRIRLKLLKIADDFVDFVDVPWSEPIDIVMTGSLANYNWSKRFSDIDVHIKIPYKSVDKNTKLVGEYFSSKKKIWNETHKNIKICGFPVELYVEDDVENNSEGGIYSLEKNEWIRTPDKEKMSTKFIDFEFVQKKASLFCTIIERLRDLYTKNTGDKHIESKIHILSEKILNLIYKVREYGFKKYENEMNNYNIVFKALRRMGYVDIIHDLIDNTYDDINSIDENS